MSDQNKWESTEIVDLDDADLGPRTKVFKYQGNYYVALEATGDAAAVYRNATMRAARFKDGEFDRVEGGADAEPILVAECLYKAVVSRDETGKPRYTLPLLQDGKTINKGMRVPVLVIRSWPNRVIKPIYDWLRENSLLREEEETEEALTKAIAVAQKKLAKLRGEGSGPKEQQSDTPDGSSSQPT